VPHPLPEPGSDSSVDDAAEPSGSPWVDLDAYVALPRLGGLLVGPGRELLVSASALNADRTAYVTAWWKLDPEGELPARRYTRSVEGESSAAYLPDGSLLFTSKRAVPPAGTEGDRNDVSAVWCLPAGGGEAYVVAERPGGWQDIVAARNGGRVLFSVGRHVGADDEAADAELRAVRKKRKVSAILHEGYPVRFWDHDLGLEETRLLAVDPDQERDSSGDLRLTVDDLQDLLPAAGKRIASAPSITAAGDVAVLEWTDPRPGGVTVTSVAEVLDGADSFRLLAEADEDFEYGAPVISDDGALVACIRTRRSTPLLAEDQQLWLVDRSAGTGRMLAADWDAWPSPQVFSADGTELFVTVDEDGHGPIYAVDVTTGDRRRLTQDGTHTSLQRSSDGATLYALRSSYSDPGTAIAISLGSGETIELKSPVTYPELPGRLENVETVTPDGVCIRAYLALPDGPSGLSDPQSPAPLALWIHGGPLGSWNSWSWRWCPWLLVAQGYAVLLPDPALSTGYGLDFIQRGWGEWGGAPYTDLMAITDAVEARDDIDGSSTVAMGGSFGGYMANWIAGHTDRFAAIVTHASLWNLETFGATTDASWYWARELTPEAQTRNSPHRSADQIRTPMLVIHGDKDYRVPISEGIALWWELVSRHVGPPEELPHKFLYFPDENHWVLAPQHAIVWYETVLAFLESRVRGGNFVRPETL
jgi:dipeptidyl aminopeptidase/acylaminoacyl peptidase